MLGKITILFTFIVICHCQNANYSITFNKKRPHDHYGYDPFYHYHHMLYGGGLFYYFAFILVKIKVVFVLGTLLTVFIVAGKFYALIKYAEYMKGKTDHHETEKIYIPATDHSHHHHEPVSYSSPTNAFSFSHSSSYFPGMTVDKLPPNAEIARNQYYDTAPPYATSRSYDGSKKDHGLYYYYNFFASLLRKLPVTEITFDTIKLSTNECRKKFVCKIEYNAKYSSILSQTLHFLRDDYYDKYKPNSTVRFSSDCDKLYQNCEANI